MKITRGKLKKIIAEESQRLSEAHPNPMRHADWAMGTYADEAIMQNVVSAVQDLVADLDLEIGGENFDRAERRELRDDVVTLLLHNILDSLGMMNQARALRGTLR